MQTDPHVKSGADATTPHDSPRRRYDVDWLRTIALGLLIVFHIVLSFQSWAAATGFPQNEQLLEGLVPLVSMLAVWRIPLLFLISGMAVRFALERRDWKGLLKDRTIRILLPFLFGFCVMGPIFGRALPLLGWTAEYTIDFGHLWFLVNIYAYVLWLIYTLVYLKEHPDNPLIRFLSKAISQPIGILLFALPLMLEAWLVNPEYFAIYVDTLHGWLMGLICFFLGFVFICVEDDFWPAVTSTRFVTLAVALSLYLIRLTVYELHGEPNALTALESMCWILAAMGFGAAYLNRPSVALGYLSTAVFPIYIVHVPVQFTIAYFLLPLPLPAYLKLLIMLVGTFGISLLLYEWILKRLGWLRPLFGMKLRRV